jgi:hypothetical protein
MQSRTFAVLLYGAMMLAPRAFAAQHGTAPPSPTHPSAAVPATTYASAFAGYVSLREEKLAPWRDVNDEVARVGGHIGILRGTAATGAKPATKSPASGAAKK